MTNAGRQGVNNAANQRLGRESAGSMSWRIWDYFTSGSPRSTPYLTKKVALAGSRHWYGVSDLRPESLGLLRIVPTA